MYVCVCDVCVLYIFMRCMYCYIYILYFIYLYFLTTYSAPFERFNGHLLTNCKCFGLLLPLLPSLLLCDDLASAIKVMCITNLPLFMHTKIARQLTFVCVRVARLGSLVLTAQKKNPKSRVKCEKYFRVYVPQYTHTNKIPWSSLPIIQIRY